MQFSCNETGEDFSAISYMIFADFTDLIDRYVHEKVDLNVFEWRPGGPECRDQRVFLGF